MNNSSKHAASHTHIRTHTNTPFMRSLRFGSPLYCSMQALVCGAAKTIDRLGLDMHLCILCYARCAARIAREAIIVLIRKSAINYRVVFRNSRQRKKIVSERGENKRERRSSSNYSAGQIEFNRRWCWNKRLPWKAIADGNFPSNRPVMHNTMLHRALAAEQFMPVGQYWMHSTMTTEMIAANGLSSRCVPCDMNAAEASPQPQPPHSSDNFALVGEASRGNPLNMIYMPPFHWSARTTNGSIHATALPYGHVTVGWLSLNRP